ncbi:MAG: hypothetical protein A2Y73_07710 [Chloroflexi bacterium RBG_13_56_8]|nr:MAG: hypothetical protein A2Y73_07710 [Chloroflexi bacterium RBG_13_56_8]
MANLQVVGVGVSVVDVLMRMRELPTWDRERHAPASGFSLQGGGPVATAMVAASRLGARVGCVSTAGNDDLGKAKVCALEEEGVDVSHMVIRPEPEHQVSLVFVHEDTGERIFVGLDRYESSQLRASDLDRDYVTSGEYLHVDGLRSGAALQAAKWMREVGKQVMLDGIKTSAPSLDSGFHALVKYVDFLVCGSGFAPALTGKTDIWEAGEAALELGPSIVVQTEGAKGCYTVTAEERFHTPAFKVKVIDTTGAGDVFHGAYLVGLLHRWNPRQCAVFASAVSAIKCTKLGGRAGIPTFEETIAFLRERDIELEG